jgi:hypothetical protein
MEALPGVRAHRTTAAWKQLWKGFHGGYAALDGRGHGRMADGGWQRAEGGCGPECSPSLGPLNRFRMRTLTSLRHMPSAILPCPPPSAILPCPHSLRQSPASLPLASPHPIPTSSAPWSLLACVVTNTAPRRSQRSWVRMTTVRSIRRTYSGQSAVYGLKSASVMANSSRRWPRSIRGSPSSGSSTSRCG